MKRKMAMTNKTDEYIEFPHKHLRSLAIRDYMAQAHIQRAVCFTCGNAGSELKKVGVDVLIIGGSSGDLLPNKWYTQADVRCDFPNYFDATSGHLPTSVMLDIAKRYRAYLGDIDAPEILVPSGSGECAICMKIAYPDKRIVAVYNVPGKEIPTQYEPDEILNDFVKAIVDEMRIL